MRIDAQVMVNRGQDVAEVHRPAGRRGTEPVGRADDLPTFMPPPERMAEFTRTQ